MKKTLSILFLMLGATGLLAQSAVITTNPVPRVINAGAHFAFFGGGTGQAPLTYQWQFNGNTISGATNSSLALTNLVATNSGTYTFVLRANDGSTASASAPLTVYTGLFPFSPTNLVMLRYSDGLSAIGTTSGLTVYLDQYTTNGTYVSTLMIPDATNTPNSTPNSELVAFGGNVENYMTLSVNGKYLNFMGFNYQRPGSGSLASSNSTAVPRAIGAVSGLGYYQLAVSDKTLFSGNLGTSIASTDGLTNFWTVAANAGASGGIVFVQPNLPDIAVGTNEGNGAEHEVGIWGGNLIVGTTTTAGSYRGQALFQYFGLPTYADTPINPGIIPGTSSATGFANPNDFAFSPDGQTVYVADGSNTGTSGGGISRWDNGAPYGLSGWVSNYTIANVPNSGTGNDGPDGLTVDWSGFTGGGSAGSGAIIYLTSGQSPGTFLTRIVDTNTSGASYTAPTGQNNLNLASLTNTVNQSWRGIRFAPVSVGTTIDSNPGSLVAVEGSTALFTVAAEGSLPLIYQWYFGANALTNGGAISGVNNATLVISNVTPPNVGSYYVVISNLISGATSSVVSLSLSSADPGIAIPPTDLNVNYGAMAVFNVTAAGTAPFTYQWLKNSSAVGNGPTGTGSTITGATTSSLTITHAACGDIGSYSVTVGNQYGPVTSGNALLTVNDPYFSVQPVPTAAVTGTTAIISASVLGTAPLSYQWYSNGVALSDGGGVTGSLTTNLTLSSVVAAEAANYSLQVVGGCNSSNVLSSVAALAVITPPQSRTVSVGETVSFVANGGQSYQWSFGGNPISGATSSALLLTNVQTTNAGQYTVAINAGLTNLNATLTVVPGLFTLYPTNLIILRVGDGAAALNTTGNSLFLDQFTTNGTYLNTTMIPDAGASAFVGMNNLTVNYMSRSANNQYLNFAGFNVAKPYGGSTTLAAAPAASAPRAVAAVNGLGLYTLANVDTNSIYDAKQIQGITSSDGLSQFWADGTGGLVYMISGGADSLIAPAGRYSATIFSNNLYATFTGNLGEFTGIPTSTATPTALLTSGNPNDFAISPDGLTIYLADGSHIGGAGGILRWDYNGSSWVNTYSFGPPTASTSANNGPDGLAVDFTQFTGGGTAGVGAVLYCTTGESPANFVARVVDNGSTSPIAFIAAAGPNQVLRGIRFGPIAVAPSIVTQPISQTNAAGSTVTFSVGVSGTAPFAYQWRFNSNNIPGATGPAFSITNVQATNAGTYSVLVSSGAGSVPSANAILTVTGGATPPPQFGAITLTGGDTVQLTFSGTPGNAYRLWTTTSLALKPVTNTWTLLSSGAFGASAVIYNDSTTNATARFYTVTTP